MAPTIPTTEPTLLVSGTTWQWNPSFADFPPSDGWVITYRLVGATTKEISVTNTGTGYEVSLPYGETTVPPGSYTLSGYATLAGARHPLPSRQVLVVEGGAVEQKGAARRLWCEQMLEIVQAVLMGKASADMLEYSIAGKSVKTFTLQELWQLRTSLRNELYVKRTGRRGQPLRVRFGNG